MIVCSSWDAGLRGRGSARQFYSGRRSRYQRRAVTLAPARAERHAEIRFPPPRGEIAVVVLAATPAGPVGWSAAASLPRTGGRRGRLFGGERAPTLLPNLRVPPGVRPQQSDSAPRRPPTSSRGHWSLSVHRLHFHCPDGVARPPWPSCPARMKSSGRPIPGRDLSARAVPCPPTRNATPRNWSANYAHAFGPGSRWRPPRHCRG